MPLNLDSYLGLDARALQLEALRTQVLAANLANADTPDYKARDIAFRAALAQASGEAGPGGPLALDVTNPRDLSGASSPAQGAVSLNPTDLKYRVPFAPSLDGNTVDAQQQKAAFAQNAVRYQATLTFLNAKLRALMTAITGQ